MTTPPSDEVRLDILMVANTLPPHDLSGAGEQIVQLRYGLEQRGHKVRILGRGRQGAVGPKVLFPISVIWPLLRDLWRRRPDVVQVHESDGGIATLVVRFLAPRPRPRLIGLQQVSYKEERRAVRPLVDHSDQDRVLARPTAEERNFRRFRTPLQILLGRITSRLCDLVLVPSEKTGEELERDYGLRRFEVVPNVTGAVLEKTAVPRVVSPRVSGESEYLLFVGRLRIRKGVEVLLEALSCDVDSRLIVAGDGERRAELEASAQRLGVAGRVEFVGRQSREKLQQLLAGATALVVPSTYEGMPLVILEAMEHGIPVVASAVSGIPEVVLDGETGWLVPPEDVQALGQALREVTAHPQQGRLRGRAGQQRLEDLYRPRHAAAAWHSFVQAL